MNITRNRVELSSALPLTHAESVHLVIVVIAAASAAFFPFFHMLLSNRVQDASIWFGSVLSKTDSIHSQQYKNGPESGTYKTMKYRKKRNVCKNSRNKNTQHSTTEQQKITCSMLVCIMLCRSFVICVFALTSI